MSFGIKSAPSAFQRIMSQVLRNCPGTFCYLDDILILEKDKDTLRQRLQLVKEKLKTANIRINHGKSTDYTEAVD